MKKTLAVLMLGFLSFQMTGCVALLAGGATATGLAVHDRRSFGTVIDDNALELRVRDALYSNEEFTRDHRIKINAFRGWVLLAGEVETDANVRLAGETAAGVTGVRRVINELVPERQASLGQGSQDRWISGKVNGSMTRIRELPGFDATRVQVITTRGVVYLMGLVSRDEAEAVTERARTVRGVHRVVTIFEYLEDQPEVVQG